MPSHRIYFENESGIRLAGIIDLPAAAPRAFALFSHCFTCTKDLKAIVRISRGLARHGIAVVRFDFTGLGDSHGDFSESNFETNLSDIRAAVNWMKSEYGSPQILIGHSLGGAAMMALAGQTDRPTDRQTEGAVGLVTLAAPSCTRHLAEFLNQQNPDVQEIGHGEITIGGRTYTMRRQLLESFRARDLKSEIKQIDCHHLILHSPVDQTLDFRHAEEIFALTGGPKSLVTLDGSDHLLINQKSDVDFVADLIALWSKRLKIV